MEKLSKTEVAYVVKIDSSILCGDCTFKKGKPDEGRCAWLAQDVPISYAHGSCDEWKTGDVTVPFLPPYQTKIQLGYLENPVGYGCRRCSHFSPSEKDCSEVDRKSPGLSPGIISPWGCCRLWQKDGLRGGKTDSQLVSILQEKPKMVLKVGR